MPIHSADSPRLMPIPSEHASYAWTAEQIQDDPEEFKRAFGSLATGRVCGKPPYFEITPRDPDQCITLGKFNMGPRSWRELTMLPQQLTIHAPITDVIMNGLGDHLNNFPHRETLIEELTGKPVAWYAVDAGLEIDADPNEHLTLERQIELAEKGGIRLKIAEYDCQGAYPGGLLQAGDEVGFSHFAQLQAELKAIDRPMRRYHYRDNAPMFDHTSYDRITDDWLWITEWSPWEAIEEISLLVRARRWERGAAEVLQMTDPSVIMTGYEMRDYKGTLGAPEVRLALLLADPEATDIAISIFRKAGMHAVVKALYGARKEATWAAQAKGSKEQTEYGRPHIISELNNCREDGLPVRMPAVIQPRYNPCTLANLGYRFAPKDMATVSEWAYGQYAANNFQTDFVGGDKVFKTPLTPGNEGKYFTGLRFFITLKDIAKKHDSHFELAAAVMRARDSRFSIHGSTDALSGLVRLAGVSLAGNYSYNERGLHIASY